MTMNLGEIMERLHKLNDLLFVKYKRHTYVLFALIIVFMVVGVFKYENAKYSGKMLTASQIKAMIAEIEKGTYGEGGVDLSRMVKEERTIRESGHLKEKTSTSYPVSQQDSYIYQVRAILTWTDEPDYNILYDNQPDEFRMTVSSPDSNYTLSSDWVANKHGEEGRIELTLTLPDEIVKHLSPGDSWTVTVEMGEAGDQKKIRPLPGIIGRRDDGNDFTLEIVLEYYAPPPE
ncbi:MAG: hypothetical protein J7L88_00975 [Thermoplasmata archaeon]|nr:hypothetical protein [Thermoplasmata archaeon]